MALESPSECFKHELTEQEKDVLIRAQKKVVVL